MEVGSDIYIKNNYGVFVTFRKKMVEPDFFINFSNSLIIHLVKTKEIRTVTEFGNLILTVVLVSIEKIYQTLDRMFHHIQNTSKFVKNTPLRVVFSTLFSVFGVVMKNAVSCLIFRAPNRPFR